MELEASGLPWAIQELTKEVVDSARINALLSEADTIIRLLREMSNLHEYVLFLFLYSPPSFDLVPSDEGSLKQDEPNTITTRQKETMIEHGNNFRPY